MSHVRAIAAELDRTGRKAKQKERGGIKGPRLLLRSKVKCIWNKRGGEWNDRRLQSGFKIHFLR